MIQYIRHISELSISDLQAVRIRLSERIKNESDPDEKKKLEKHLISVVEEMDYKLKWLKF